MSKLFWQVLKTTPAILGASLMVAGSAMANEVAPVNSNEAQTSQILNQINQYNKDSDSMSQVTNVSEMRDVSPSDWAYEALRNLVERYGCIVGYPDQTFRGNRPMTRYEFAAGVSACADQMERLIAASEAVTREDIEKLQRLTQEFQAELAALGGRVDNLESRTAFLEDHQFSTTTKLAGEVIFSISDAFGGGDDNDEVVTLNDRVRLNFDTSFTGKDRLRTRLEAGNMPRYDRVDGLYGTPAARLGYDTNNENTFQLTQLWYRFPVGDKATIHLAANGVTLDDVWDTYNPFLSSSSEGAVSRFARFNPTIYRQGSAGIAANYKFNDKFGLDFAYLAGNAADPNEGNGLFNGSFSLGGQFNWRPVESFKVGLAYVYSYDPADQVNLDGSAGSTTSHDPYVNRFGQESAATANRLGLQASWRVAEKFNIAGWFGYSFTSAEGGPFDGRDADIINGAINLAVVDLGKEGSVLGLTFGIPPASNFGRDTDTTYFVEAMYKYPITDNISITPGAYVLIDPNQNSDNDTIVVGTVRTTFKF